MRIWRALTGFLALALSVLAALFYRKEAKYQEDRADENEAEAESLSRQSEALRERQTESQEAINEARDKRFSPDDINRLLDDES